MLLLSNFEHFSGAGNQNWEKWINRFEAKTSSLPATDRLPCLISVLEGGALDLFASLPDQDRGDYTIVSTALAGRFGHLRSPLQAQVELARARQQPGESVLDFADRIRQLGRLAHPQATPCDATVEASLKGLFICGLYDAGLQSIICCKNPNTLEAAVHIAREFQCQRDALLAMRQSPIAAAAHENTTSHAMLASNNAPGANSATTIQSLERRMDEVQQTLQQLVTENSGRRFASPRSAGNMGMSQRSSTQAGAARPVIRCYECGEPNHVRRFCPTLRNFQEPRMAPTSRHCFVCGDNEHRFRDCPYASAQDGRPFCLRCRREGHWLVECRSTPMGGGSARNDAGHAPEQVLRQGN